MRRLMGLLVGMVLVAIPGCKKDKEEFDILPGNIFEVSVSSDTVAYGETVTVQVRFGGGTNGCAKPDYLETRVVINTVFIDAFYKYPKEPRVCTANIPTHKLTFDYKPASSGTHVLRSDSDPVIADTLFVH